MVGERLCGRYCCTAVYVDSNMAWLLRKERKMIKKLGDDHMVLSGTLPEICTEVQCVLEAFYGILSCEFGVEKAGAILAGVGRAAVNPDLPMEEAFVEFEELKRSER